MILIDFVHVIYDIIDECVYAIVCLHSVDKQFLKCIYCVVWLKTEHLLQKILYFGYLLHE